MTKTEGKTARKARRMTREGKPAGTDTPASASNDGAAGEANDISLAAALPAPPAKPAKAASKTSLVVDMLRRPEGATLEQMVAATGWLPHTTRAVLTGLKKKGHIVTSEKDDSVRTYRVVQTASAKVTNDYTETTEA